MTTAIEMCGIDKAFGPVKALRQLNLSVETGQVHGFLGPNGAGKSTAIRVLLGMLRANAGWAQVLGGDPWRDSVALHRRLAYVPGDVTLWPSMTGGEVIDFMTHLRGGGNATRRAELIERFQLDPRRKCRTYSKGNRQKVGIISALASDVELLILDEPTSGLDPLMEAVFQDVIRADRAAGRTVLLSSHILSEVEALCDSVSIIRDGTVVESGTLADLRHLTRTSIEVQLEYPCDLRGWQGVHDFRQIGQQLTMSVDTYAVGWVMKTLAAGGIRTLSCQMPTLEELFLRHYGTTGGQQ